MVDVVPAVMFNTVARIWKALDGARIDGAVVIDAQRNIDRRSDVFKRTAAWRWTFKLSHIEFPVGGSFMELPGNLWAALNKELGTPSFTISDNSLRWDVPGRFSTCHVEAGWNQVRVYTDIDDVMYVLMFQTHGGGGTDHDHTGDRVVAVFNDWSRLVDAMERVIAASGNKLTGTLSVCPTTPDQVTLSGVSPCGVWSPQRGWMTKDGQRPLAIDDLL